ncbi:MAG: hypothetical protein ACOZNI_20725 [Myxococcota bacterium]
MIADVVLTLAGMLHGGGLGVFALLLLFRGAIAHARDEDVVRVYRAWGAGNGLTLGALIFAGAWKYATEVNPGKGLPDAFALPDGDWLTAARLGLFFVYWVSYVWLEIWTLDPCRLLDKGEIADRAAYAAATRRVTGQLAFNAVVFAVVVALGVVGARP